MSALSEMPRYQCHKIVRALQIGSIEVMAAGSIIYPMDQGYAPIEVNANWMTRFKPIDSDLGYYVVYEDGYASWSPSKAFEDGYSFIK